MPPNRQDGAARTRVSVWPADEPDAVAREIRTAYGGGLTMAAGHAAVATPGALAGRDLAQTRWGSLPVATGDLMVIDGLADTLALIVAEGARTMYDGELARLVVADMADRGGLGPEGRGRRTTSPGSSRCSGGCSTRAATASTASTASTWGDGSTRIEAEEDLPLPPPDLPVLRHHRHPMYFGGVGAAQRLASGELEATADPWRAGAIAVSPAV